MKPDKRVDWAAVVILFVVGLAARIVFARGFDGLYGQDAYAYFNAASQLFTGAPFSPFYWGIGYPALLMIAFALLGVSAWTAQAITIVCGALIAPVMYGIARELKQDRGGAFFAGLLIVIGAQSIQSSIVVMSDIPAILWAVLSAYCLVRYAKGNRTAWLIGAASFLAFAGITRWLAFALVPVWAIFILLSGRRIMLRDSVFAFIAAGLIIVPQIAFAALHPTPVIDHAWVQGWSLENAFRKDFINVDGEFHFAVINARFYAAPLSDPVYLSPLLLPLILFGIWRTRQDRAALVLNIGWWIVPFVFLIGIPYQNIRFSLLNLPPAALLIGAGFSALMHTPARVIRIGTVIGAAIGLMLMIGTANEYVGTFVERQQADRAVITWAANNIPDDVTIYTMGLTLPLRIAHPGEVRELYYETDETLTAVAARHEPAYLLINLWQIEHQWQGRAPALAVEWLRRERGINRIGQNGYYSLYWIAP